MTVDIGMSLCDMLMALVPDNLKEQVIMKCPKCSHNILDSYGHHLINHTSISTLSVYLGRQSPC